MMMLDNILLNLYNTFHVIYFQNIIIGFKKNNVLKNYIYIYYLIFILKINKFIKIEK